MNHFARSHLQKHGWKQGKGLGRSESGMKEAIKVKRKNNTNGLGHNQGGEFTFHWWDHVFNKAANSIKVSSTEDGHDKIEKDENAKKLTPLLISNKQPLKGIHNGKPLLYGSFVKAGTLEEEVGNDFLSSEDESDSENDATDTLERTFKLTGLTGHKAARHGHKLTGKLQRIQEQESNAKIKTTKDKSQRNNKSSCEEKPICNSKTSIENDEKPSKKKKKKKESENGSEEPPKKRKLVTEDLVTNDNLTNDSIKKTKKNKKKV